MNQVDDMVCTLDVNSQEEAGSSLLVKLSPYSEIVALRLPDQVLHVHGFLLDMSPKLSTMALSKDGIDMSEFSSATGHAMAHFLYTGQYHGNNDTNADIDTASNSQDALRSNFEVYAAASKYQLIGLREKAQEAIETTPTDNVNPAEVLGVIKKTLPLPDLSDVWLRTYTKGMLDAAYADVASFLESELMSADQAESTMSITEMLLRAVINTQREKQEQEERERREAEERLRQEQEEKEKREQEEREKREQEEREKREQEERDRQAAELAEQEAKALEAAELAKRIAEECEAAELAAREAKEQEAAELAVQVAKECEAADIAEREASERQAAEVAERDAHIAALIAEQDGLEHKQRIGMGRLFGKLSKKERARLEAIREELASMKSDGVSLTEPPADKSEVVEIIIDGSNEAEKKPGLFVKGRKAAAAECVVAPTTRASPEWGHSKTSRALGFYK